MSLAARASTDVAELALDAFLETVAVTLHEATGVGVDAPSCGRAEESISVIIHARGSLSGVTWRFPVALAARAAWKMAPDLVPDHALCELAAGELANMLTGRGLEALAGCGVRIEIEPPQIAAACAPGVSGHLRTELGAVEVVFHGPGRSA